MPQICHRCGGELPEASGESPFCPHCGAPQLRLSLENQSATDSEAPGTTGAAAPPRPRQVDWKAAIRCALLVSGVAAALSLGAARVEVLSSVMLLWVFSASMVALRLYQRQRPAAWMDIRVGARIGIVVGLCLALALGAATAAWGMISRYVLHSMGSFDAQMTDMVKQMTDAVSHSMQQIPPEKAGSILGFVQSPEFRGAVVAVGFGLTSAMLLVLSIIGGAFAGLLRMRRGPAV
jgi:hypothetical protein